MTTGAGYRPFHSFSFVLPLVWAACVTTTINKSKMSEIRPNSLPIGPGQLAGAIVSSFTAFSLSYLINLRCADRQYLCTSSGRGSGFSAHPRRLVGCSHNMVQGFARSNSGNCLLSHSTRKLRFLLSYWTVLQCNCRNTRASVVDSTPCH